MSGLLHRLSGISLSDGKEGLVQARLGKRMRALGIGRVTDYLAFIEQDASGRELTSMLDALTTNKTSWFRETPHFAHLADHLVPAWRTAGRQVSVWSAASSSGEEPYSIALQIRDRWPDVGSAVRILATDLSTVVLRRAREAIYDERALAEVPPTMRHAGFVRADGAAGGRWRVADDVRAMVRFARLNLMDAWPMRGPFDLIVCRNVMIYFDRPTQQRLIERFTDLLAPAGVLYVGHSESLSGIRHRLRYVQPAVYAR